MNSFKESGRTPPSEMKYGRSYAARASMTTGAGSGTGVSGSSRLVIDCDILRCTHQFVSPPGQRIGGFNRKLVIMHSAF